MLAGDVLVRFLTSIGVDTVFGIPGGLIFEFFQCLDASEEIEFVYCSHENGAVYAADAYARVGRRLGVAMVTSGPGIMNTTNAVSIAQADSVPLLLISGNPLRKFSGRGALQENDRETDAANVFEPLTKYSAFMTSPDSFIYQLRRAVRSALTGRQGPVHLSFPYDIWSTEISVTEADFSPMEKWCPTMTHVRPDAEAVQKAVAILRHSERPIIMVGTGVRVSDAKQQVLDLASHIGARIVTSVKAKGVISEGHPLSMGISGYGASSYMRSVMRNEADVLLAVGCGLNESSTDTFHEKFVGDKKLIQVDIDPNRFGRAFLADVAVLGDAKATMIDMLQAYQDSDPEPRAMWMPKTPVTEESSTPEAATAPVTPTQWRREAAKLLPKNSVLVGDCGGNMFFTFKEFKLDGQIFVQNLNMASMGYGVGAAVGAQVALGKQGRAVAVVGDGGFYMHGLELRTAVQYGLPIIVVVENNRGHNIVRQAARLLLGRDVGGCVWSPPTDFAALARSMGASGITVDSPGQMTTAFAEALSHTGGPTLIDVRVDPEAVIPAGERYDSLRQGKASRAG